MPWWATPLFSPGRTAPRRNGGLLIRSWALKRPSTNTTGVRGGRNRRARLRKMPVVGMTRWFQAARTSWRSGSRIGNQHERGALSVRLRADLSIPAVGWLAAGGLAQDAT